MPFFIRIKSIIEAEKIANTIKNAPTVTPEKAPIKLIVVAKIAARHTQWMMIFVLA